MAIKFNRVTLNEKAYRKFQEIKKRYYERHNLSKDIKISESDIFLDYVRHMEGE